MSIKPARSQQQFSTATDREGANTASATGSAILAFYAKGMTTRDIADTLREVYGAEVSPRWWRR